MSKPELLVFDDRHGNFGPLTDLRAAFELRAGIGTLLETIEAALDQRAKVVLVDPGVAALVRERTNAAVNEWPASGPDWLLVNGRWLSTDPSQNATIRKLQSGQSLVQKNGQVVAACLPSKAAKEWIDSGFVTPPAPMIQEPWKGPDLIARPWDLIEQTPQTLVGHYGKDAARIDPTARLHPGVVCDTQKGPVIVGEYASIGANSVLEGPCCIGAYTVVQPLSLIRGGTVIGPHCKVAGEISCSIIQGCTNKAHAGFLGHSLVGEWVNLGADTTVSNLKNTYGTVRLQFQPGGPTEDSGRIFQGPIIGDHVRTAIGSRLPTGAVLQTGCMFALAGFVPKSSRRFGFYTDDHPEGQPYDIEKFLGTARTMMERRQRKMSTAEEARLRGLAETKDVEPSSQKSSR